MSQQNHLLTIIFRVIAICVSTAYDLNLYFIRQNPDDQLLAKYQNLNTEKYGLETALDEMSKQKSEIETLKNNCEEEINKLKVPMIKLWFIERFNVSLRL